MKKLIIATTMLLSFNTMANTIPTTWYNDYAVDEFSDRQTGFAASPNNYVSTSCSFALFDVQRSVLHKNGDSVFVTFRVDNNKAFYFVGEWLNDFVKVDKHQFNARLLDQMKAGNNIIFRAENLEGKDVIVRESLKGFTKAYNNLECSYK